MILPKKSHCRYANCKDYELLKEGKSLGYFQTNEKNIEDEKRELSEFVEMTGADTIILRWTAREGFIGEEVAL